MDLCSVTIFIDSDGYYIISSQSQNKILIILSENRNMTVRKIANRTGLRYGRVYKELQKLVDRGIVIKYDGTYSLNPEYGDCYYNRSVAFAVLKNIIYQSFKSQLALFTHQKKETRRYFPIIVTFLHQSIQMLIQKIIG